MNRETPIDIPIPLRPPSALVVGGEAGEQFREAEATEERLGDMALDQQVELAAEAAAAGALAADAPNKAAPRRRRHTIIRGETSEPAVTDKQPPTPDYGSDIMRRVSDTLRRRGASRNLGKTSLRQVRAPRGAAGESSAA